MKLNSVDRTPNYIMVRIEDVDRDLMYEAAKWCVITQCGKRVSWKCFAFKTEEEFLMFSLKWL